MIVSDVRSRQLRLVLSVGLDPVSGRAIMKTKSFSNIKPAATNEAVFAVANAFVSLQTSPLASIISNNVMHLYEDN